MKKLKLFSIAVLFLTYACQKEPVKNIVLLPPAAPVVEEEIIESDPPLTSWHKDLVIFAAGDTSTGYATAIKNGKKWESSGFAFLYNDHAMGKRYLAIYLTTYTKGDPGFLKEKMSFRAVELKIEKLAIKAYSSNNIPNVSFAKLGSGGDLLYGLFDADNDYNNRFELTKVDTIQKCIEGNFNIQLFDNLFKTKELIRLSNGKFKLKIIKKPE